MPGKHFKLMKKTSPAGQKPGVKIGWVRKLFVSGNFSGLGGPPVNYATRNCLLHSDQTPPSILPKCLGKLLGRGQVSHIWYLSSSHSQNAGLLSTRRNLFEKAAMLTQYTAALAFLNALFAFRGKMSNRSVVIKSNIPVYELPCRQIH